jgi:hypothetical protein
MPPICSSLIAGSSTMVRMSSSRTCRFSPPFARSARASGEQELLQLFHSAASTARHPA